MPNTVRQGENSRHESTEKSKHYRKQNQPTDEHSHTSTPAFTDNNAKASRNSHLDSVSASKLTTLPTQPASQVGNLDMPRQINPKDLTNEELEYVIKTGKVPPKYLSSFKTTPIPASVGSTATPSIGTPRQTLAPRMSPREMRSRNEFETQI